ncbi:MAG: hypothetical protein AB1758_29690, partial [Candidatus Eremiobacterota bacterium]
EALRGVLRPELRAVGIMGGHGLKRTDPVYRQAAVLGRSLVQAGYYVVTGGGPGVMEAGNLGAYLGRHSPGELEEALSLLARAPHFRDKGYVAAALDVLEAFPEGLDNLAVPTWFYGHEPSNVFARYIAKYFSNSLREDNLLAVCLHGIVYCPGSAGTTQEIFQDATQNHYGTFGWYSPMCFLGVQRYRVDTQLFPMLQRLARDRPYADMLFLSDEPEEIVEFLRSHPPARV